MSIRKMLLLLLAIFILSINNIKSQVKFDSFIGGSYYSITDRDSTRAIISSEKWQQFKTSIGCTIFKNTYVGTTLLYGKVKYTDWFADANEKYLNISANLYYKEKISKKFVLDVGVEVIRTAFNRNIQGAPIQNKWGIYLGGLLNLSYKLTPNLYLSSQNNLAFKIRKQAIENPFVSFTIGIKYNNAYTEE